MANRYLHLNQMESIVFIGNYRQMIVDEKIPNNHFDSVAQNDRVKCTRCFDISLNTFFDFSICEFFFSLIHILRIEQSAHARH